MSLPFDPAQVHEYTWSELGLGLTMKNGDVRIIKRADVTKEIIEIVQQETGELPPWE